MRPNGKSDVSMAVLPNSLIHLVISSVSKVFSHAYSPVYWRTLLFCTTYHRLSVIVSGSPLWLTYGVRVAWRRGPFVGATSRYTKADNVRVYLYTNTLSANCWSAPIHYEIRQRNL